MISGDIFGSLVDGKRRRGRLSIDGGQENARVSSAEEGELSSESGTHPNVVLGSIRAKAELYDRKHVLYGKRRDLLWLEHGRTLQFSEAFARELYQIPGRW